MLEISGPEHMMHNKMFSGLYCREKVKKFKGNSNIITLFYFEKRKLVAKLIVTPSGC